ncbi:hypothetical protein IJ00_18305 [Calothrix sp. 336/3]|nr:tetratricopeptide repeat protein [Calothrix sp. 336/3]AKG22971.1 hypothetical protein IJ00_18305 [Calothrix sp. 336/3]
MRPWNIIIFAICFSLCSNLSVLAKSQKTKQPDKFPPSPLEITAPDPLLPRIPDKEPLTEAEKQALGIKLDELNLEATAKFAAGDKITAFEIWNRELRLRRYLGVLAEIEALSRVGAIAYQDNERQQVQYITQRLQAIQAQTQSQQPGDLQILSALGKAYQQVRSPQLAIPVYQQILTQVRQQQDTAAERETLQTIANVHLGWFDYPQAAKTYEELLNLTKGEPSTQITYLEQLAYIYEQAKQPQDSVKIRQQLVEIYQQDSNLTSKLVGLKLAIGSDYEMLAKQQPDLIQAAFKNYQESYTTAWQLQEYTRAGEALNKLISLYRSTGQTDEALQTSQILLQTEELAANFYGLMTAYDQIGQIYVERKDYPQAINAFQKGLELAKELKHEEQYFNQQIAKIAPGANN